MKWEPKGSLSSCIVQGDKRPGFFICFGRVVSSSRRATEKSGGAISDSASYLCLFSCCSKNRGAFVCSVCHDYSCFLCSFDELVQTFSR